MQRVERNQTRGRHSNYRSVPMNWFRQSATSAGQFTKRNWFTCHRAFSTLRRAMLNSTPPILFLIFNRPESAREVFRRIRSAAPKRLYVAADGPRQDNPGDSKSCAETRSIVDALDWDCRVEQLFRDENLGCRKAVSSAIDWFFENEEHGIIIEDDCLPDPSFFRFCSELLEKYRCTDNVMTINGSNFQFGEKRGEASYFFSRCPHVWGWATWRRAWQRFDIEMKSFPGFSRERRIDDFFADRRMRQHYSTLLRAAFEQRIDSWAYPLLYSVLSHDGLCISPNTNLVENIGWQSGTHTALTGVSWLKRMTMGRIYRRLMTNRAQSVPFPLTHTPEVTLDPSADLHHFRMCIDSPFMRLHIRLKYGSGG